ncbi:MAG: putative chromosome-partitioning protein ParB [Phycisphaerae bacterium]|nr:putative chromosome-partitioning protein ParB [Phycisphaerae bacterium]
MTTNRLGRGLSAIIPTRATQLAEPHPKPNVGETHKIPINQILPNPRQPRATFTTANLTELTASIRLTGVLQPIIVRPMPDGTYEIIAGERRWRAAQAAGLTEIPATIRHVGDAESLELALVENLQREDLKPLERAAGYQNYLDQFKGGVDSLAAKLGESRANITNYLRLLRLGVEIRELIETGQLGMGQARAIAGITDPQRQLAVAKLAVRRNLSVRQVEALAARERATAATRARAAATNSYLADLERQFALTLGAKVQIQTGRRKNAGRLILHYNSLEQFEDLARRLGVRAALDES